MTTTIFSRVFFALTGGAFTGALAYGLTSAVPAQPSWACAISATLLAALAIAFGLRNDRLREGSFDSACGLWVATFLVLALCVGWSAIPGATRPDWLSHDLYCWIAGWWMCVLVFFAAYDVLAKSAARQKSYLTRPVSAAPGAMAAGVAGVAGGVASGAYFGGPFMDFTGASNLAVNIDGTPMFGAVDIKGNPFGVVSADDPATSSDWLDGPTGGAFMQDTGPLVNIDGIPMCGDVDIAGHPYGVVDVFAGSHDAFSAHDMTFSHDISTPGIFNSNDHNGF